MAILSNTPTLSYIYIKNMVITHNDTPYNVLNMYTSKPYIFWDASDPYKLIASNIMLEEKFGQYYICFNDRGNPTMVPQPDLEISFSENGNGDLITEKILGFQNTLDANEYRFTTIETDINHIKTIVGGSGGTGGDYFEQFSKLEQEIDRIEAEVSRVEKEYGTNEELRKLRENTNIALLKLQSVLGLFSSDMQGAMEDNVLTDEEASMIETYKNSMEEERMALNSQIDKVILRLEMQGELENVTKLRTQKTLLNDAINNLYSNIDIACTDKKFTNMEMATIISYFSTVGSKINETNSMVDEFIFLESNGKIIEELAKLTISQNEIKQSVSKSESDVEDVIIKLEKTIVKIDTYYYSSTSKEVLEGGEWSTTAPTWVDGRFLWTKTIATYTDESTEETDPVCITGQQGESVSSYTWIMYADDKNGNGISNDPTGKSYIGFAYNKETATESNNPSDYIWSLFKGVDGKDGLNGTDGEDGTSVKILGSYSSADELKQSHPDNNENGDGYIVDGDLWVWDGTEFINVGKIKGEDGLTAYVHIKYSNDGGSTFTPGNGEEMGDYMGVYTDNIEEDSSNVSDYNWKKIKGEDGVPGEKGEDGKSTYTWIRYSDNENGSNMYNTPNSLTVYIGIATNKDTPTESNNPTDYVWSKFKGDDGVDGRGITSITVEYYLSSSKTVLLDGIWSDMQPTWQEDWYLWIRNKIVYNNPTSTEYTTPILDETWESLKDLKDEMDLTKTEIERIKDTVSEHTVALDSITSRVESTETTITNITNRIKTSVTDVVNMYYLSSSSTELKNGEWNTSVPTNIGEKFLWSKVVTYYSDDTTNESDPICLTNDSDLSDGESGYTVILSDEIFIIQCDLDGNPL